MFPFRVIFQTPATLYRSTSDEDNELVRPDIPAHVIRIQ